VEEIEALQSILDEQAVVIVSDAPRKRLLVSVDLSFDADDVLVLPPVCMDLELPELYPGVRTC
jgi:predicted metal-dependent TIM-barrel fold hydrolase